MTETLTDLTQTLATEEANVVDISDLAEPTGGAWPKGWYKATIIEGYSTPKGKQFETADSPSAKGDSRNARVCLKVRNGDQERNMQTSLNYRPSDFAADRVAAVKEARVEFKNTPQGQSWPGEAKDLQRSSLAIAKIGQFEHAIGFSTRNGDGFSAPAQAVGKEVDIQLVVNEDDFNEVRKFDKPGSHTK